MWLEDVVCDIYKDISLEVGSLPFQHIYKDISLEVGSLPFQHIYKDISLEVGSLPLQHRMAANWYRKLVVLMKQEIVVYSLETAVGFKLQFTVWNVDISSQLYVL